MSLYEYERDGDVQALIGAMRRSDNAEVRKRAAGMLGNFPDHQDRRDVVNALVDVAEEDEGDVVAAAVDALDQLGGDAVEQLITSMADVELGDEAADWVKAKAFVQALSADLPELRMAAANALGDVGQSDAVPDLTGRFDDPDARVRARAARACGLIEDARATEPLAGLLTDPKAAVRREAAESLGRIGNRQALEALLDLYDDPDERVRRIAVEGFGHFENDRPVEYLVDALRDDSAAVCRTAVYSLIQLLSNVPTEESHDIRESVVERLAATEDETVVAPLVEILRESTQPAQRRNTAWLLGRVTDDQRNRTVVDALVEALDDDDQMTTQFAATSLAQIGGDYAENELVDVAMDGDADTAARGQAVFTLGKVGGPETKERLEKLLEETEDEQLRQKTFSALSKLGGHGA